MRQDKYQKLQSLNVEQMVSKLLNNRRQISKQFPLSEDEVVGLCNGARNMFMSQPMLLQLNPPINVCGDIHGQFSDLKEIFKSIGTPTQGKNFLFLGDYVDRGKQSLQCICLLFAYKVLYNERIFLLRGNHESSQLNKIYGFYDECKRRLSLKIWKTFCDVFKCLPVAAVIGDRIFCVHGGLSPYLNSIQAINQIIRPIQCQRNTLLSDLLWSDPGILNGWTKNIQRGTSFCFGQDIIENFLQKHDLDLICRSHQVVQDGYQFIADRKLLTIFSCPNYCSFYDNFGAILFIDGDMTCQIKQFQKQNLIRLKASRQKTPEVSLMQKLGSQSFEKLKSRNSTIQKRISYSILFSQKYLSKDF